MIRHTLYMDESGTHSFTDTREPVSKHFLITAMALSSVDDANLSGYFEYLKRKHGINRGTPFHAHEIFEDPNKRLSPAKCRALVSDLVNYIEVAPVNYSVFYLNKKACQSHFGIRLGTKNAVYTAHDHGPLSRDIAYDILASKAFWWFSDDVIQEGEKGAIIAESRQNSDHSLLDSFLICKDPDFFKPMPVGQRGFRSCDEQLLESSKQMRAKVTSLKLENKIGECPGLELADLISYVTFIHIERRMGEFVDRDLAILWKAIKKNMIGKSPTLIEGEEFSEVLPRNRVRKISKFVNSI